MTKDDIKKVLKAHKKWLDSSGEKGAKAKFVDAYLCGADLYKADLRNANLKSAKEETAEAKPYHVTVHCDNTGIKVKGARTDIGSTCDTDASSLANFLRIAEYWWHTYCKEVRNEKMRH